MKPPQLDLESINAEWKAKQVLNEDGKVINNPNSPTGTESTNEDNHAQRLNSISSVEDEVLNVKKRFMFGLENFRSWFSLYKP